MSIQIVAVYSVVLIQMNEDAFQNQDYYTNTLQILIQYSMD